MAINPDSFLAISQATAAKRARVIAVSKTKPVEDIKALYDLGQRDFGENYVQELVSKTALVPEDLRWHFIGHLQSNKVKFIAPFVYMIHGVDSLKLLREINKQGVKNFRKIKCLLQIYIAEEVTKFGLDEKELDELLDQFFSSDEMENVQICGIMAMASFSENPQQIRAEFNRAKKVFDNVKEKFFYDDDAFSEISMGMSNDYTIALEEGSTMVRIGSLIFGERSKPAV
jgi:pyridoxal phosphate enzyme (YggS family)